MYRRQAVQKDIKDLTTDISEQRNDIARLNSMLADGRVTKAALEEDVFTLQSKSDHATKVQLLSCTTLCCFLIP